MTPPKAPVTLATAKRLLESECRLRELLRRVHAEGRVDQSAHDLGNALSAIVMYRAMLVENPGDESELIQDIEAALVYADEIFVRVDVPHGGAAGRI